MGGLVAIPTVLLLAYCLVQTIRDFRRRSWVMATWGTATSALLLWLLESVTRNPGY